MGRRNGRRAAPAAGSPLPPLPAELLARVMDLLSWRETSAMSRVCSHWCSAVRTAASARFEWRVTNLLASDMLDEAPISIEDVIARLGSDYGSWADTAFPPNLVLLEARTADPRPFIKGVYWTRAVAAMERARLLPPRCLVVGTLSVCAKSSRRGRGGGDDAEKDKDSMQVTVAHLPGTELLTAMFERKELRQSARAGGVYDPFATSTSGQEAGTAGGFLLFSVNPQSAWELASAVSGWDAEGSEATPAITGGVFPHADCSNPLMLYQSNLVNKAGAPSKGSSRRQQKPASKKKSAKEDGAHRHGHQRQHQVFQQRRQHRGAPTSIVEAARVQVQFPSNLVVRLTGGRVRLSAWTASGFAPVTPIVRCCDPPIGALVPQAAVYHQVEVHCDLPEPVGQTGEAAAASRVDVGHVCTLKELVSARLNLSADQALKVIASRDLNALERFFKSSTSAVTSLELDSVETIDCGYSVVDDALFSLGERRWESGMYGVVMGRGSDDWQCREALRASERAYRDCKTCGGLPFGLLVASPIPLASTDLGVLPMATATTELTIGPSGGADPSPMVHQNATSGALLYYTRER